MKIPFIPVWSDDSRAHGRVYRFTFASFLPLLFWIGLWFSINTGPWVLRQSPTTLIGWIHYARTVFPLIILVLAGAGLMLFAGRGKGKLWKQLGPVKLWLIYGFISFFACVSSPEPWRAAWWSASYLAVFPILLFSMDARDPLGSLVRLNRLNFMVACFFFFVMLVIVRDALFVGSGLDISSYGVIDRAPTVGGAPISRSSGLARFGAIVGLLSFVYFHRASGLRKVFWGSGVVLATIFLYILQSRGAAVGYVISITFLLGIMSFERKRVLLIPIAILFIVTIFANRIPFEKIKEHLTRGEDFVKLETLGGRTSTWQRAWPVIHQSPIWGWGMQADRYLLLHFEHVHNTYLYTLLTTGILGTTAFVTGLAWAWLLLFRGLKGVLLTRSPPSDPFVYESTAILMLFTVRSIPEVCGAMFSVDFMLMLPVIAYLSLLNRNRYQRVKLHDESQYYDSMYKLCSRF